ncbi:TIGR03086 family metal-binding protein [Streptomyces sp. NPDC059740]|uniref:TIGR03086 family metal-binding protein n=1 Tax=Streptomyces sp. NPDC059740 TaxID=3346926 RepID=UPI003659A860
MYLQDQLSAAAETMARVVSTVEDGQLGAPTPCHEFDVRRLINHLIAWSPIIEGVGLRAPLASGRPDEQTDHMTGDWRAEYLRWIDRSLTAWKPDAAWEGVADLGFIQVPATVIGGKTLCEFVLHGWDLARATGQPFDCDPAVAEATLRLVEETAEETRQHGMFGSAVAVPETSSALERALAVSGRNPGWTA